MNKIPTTKILNKEYLTILKNLGLSLKHIILIYKDIKQENTEENKRIHKLMVEKFTSISIITGGILKIRWFILIILMFFIFLMIYRFIPKHKMKLKTQIVGAFFSSLAWYINSWCFSLYIDVFQGFSNTYGSLTSIILIMMWVYVCMYIILLGGEINVLLHNKEKNNKINIKNSLKHLN